VETITDNGWIEAHEILRAAVFEQLKSLVGTAFALTSAFGGFKWHLYDQNRLDQLRSVSQNRGIPESEYDYTAGNSNRELPGQDQRILTEIISNLIRQGILVLGPTISYAQQNFYTVSVYGEDCLQNEEIVPHDPDGYLALLKTRVPTLDSIIASFLEESVRCFANGCYKAAAVMCGVASERLLHVFAISLLASISNQTHSKAKKLQNALNRPWRVSDLDAAIRGIIEDSKNLKGWPLRGNELQRFILPIFAWMKVNRDSSGHPSDFQITYIEVRGQLMSFVAYLQKFYSLIDYLSQNKTQLN